MAVRKLGLMVYQLVWPKILLEVEAIAAMA
jgi:hypothetical protein